MYSDPYDDIAREVDGHLSQLRVQTTAYVTSLTSSLPSAGPTAATPTHDELLTMLDDIDMSIRDLRDSVDAASSNPDQFGLSKVQVHDRAAFVSSKEHEIADLRTQIDAATRGRKPFPSSMNGTGNHEFTSISIDDNNSPGGRGTPIDSEMEREHQALLIHEQDQQLDSVLSTVQNLRDQAAVMGNELEDHVELLQDLGDRVDSTQNKLQMGMRRIKYIMKENEDTASNACIALLLVILILLILVMIVV
ncbi:uncharacterized protein V1516DRAFT_11229 [Lipomyces oligophaga]|uniref:uncharacterized protein n=1 Tax=Lipomyces oligophaga TaxID=45792 RepID=UPI0034CE82CF